MSNLRTFVLRAWAEGDPPAGGEPPVQLLRVEDDGALAAIASHGQAVSDATVLSHQGADRDLATLLSQEKLLEADLIAAAGRELYSRLARGQVGAELARIGADCRVMLDLRSETLEGLPWELLRRDDYLLFQLEQQPWLLGSPEPPAVDPLWKGQVPLISPLRVMVVVGNDPNDPKVRGDGELRRLEDILHGCRGEVLLYVLDRPDPEDILSALSSFEPHVFHFIGHGAKVGGRPVIRVHSKKSGGTENWNADRIRAVLGGMQVPRLVILNACDTAGPGARGAWALTDAFLKRGVGALLAMQAEIRGDAALAFGERLYKGLAKDEPVDVAVARARMEVAAVLQGDGATKARANWPVPRLVVRGDPQQVVRLGRTAGRSRSVRSEEDFVDRWRQRCQAFQALFGGRHLVVVEGPQESGKTEFLKALGETWTCAGKTALFVDLDGPETSELRLVVARTRERAEEEGLNTDELAAVDLEQSSKDLGRSFRNALESLAPSPLLVLLDGLENWQRDVVVNMILPEVCVPYFHPGGESRVCLTVALREEVAKAFLWEGLEQGYRPIRVEEFQPEEWRRAAAQFIRWHRRRFGDAGRRQTFEGSAWNTARLTPPDSLIDPNVKRYPPALLNAIRMISMMWSDA